MKKSVLLTRSKSANNELKEKFISQDFDFLDCNLIKYKLFPVEAEYINKFSNLIITSNFAANNIPNAPRSDMSVWVVGEKSANSLKNKGYKVEHYAPSAENLKKQLYLDWFCKLNTEYAFFRFLVYLIRLILRQSLPLLHL